MDEFTYRTADIFIKASTAILGLVTAFLAFIQYRASQVASREKLAIERKTLSFNLSKQKAELLAEAAQTAATIATSNDSSAVLKAIERFWQLYFGPLLLVEGSAVENEVVKFGEQIQSHSRLQSIFSDEQRERLQKSALNLGAACKKEIQEFDRQLTQELKA